MVVIMTINVIIKMIIFIFIVVTFTYGAQGFSLLSGLLRRTATSNGTLIVTYLGCKVCFSESHPQKNSCHLIDRNGTGHWSRHTWASMQLNETHSFLLFFFSCLFKGKNRTCVDGDLLLHSRGRGSGGGGRDGGCSPCGGPSDRTRCQGPACACEIETSSGNLDLEILLFLLLFLLFSLC